MGGHARLVVIDPLMAYLGSEVNGFKDQDVRRALAPLSAMADRTNAAVVVVRHLRKTREGGAINAGGGSVGIGGAARSVLLVGRDPDDEERRILASIKSNLSRPPASLAFRVQEDQERRPFIGWESGTVEITADGLLAAGVGGDEERTAQGEAVEFLRMELAEGRRPADEIEAAAKRNGIAPRTLSRARRALSVKAEREGFGKEGRWFQSLPAPKDASVAPKTAVFPDGAVCDVLASYEDRYPPKAVCLYFVGEQLAGTCGRCAKPFSAHGRTEEDL